MNLRVDSQAADEVRAAALWYDERRTGLGAEFLAILDAAFERIRANPEAGSRVETLSDDPAVRWLGLRRFPYLVVYEIAQHEIRVVAVAHSRRRPNYWKDRLRARPAGE